MRMPPFTILAQYNARVLVSVSETRKTNKRHTDQKETKLLQFADNMIVYVENPSESV